MSRDGLELLWPGKYDEDGSRASIPRVPAQAQLLERHGGTSQADRLLWGDNLLALTHLESTLEGKVDLVYIDPPFATGGRFNVSTRVGEGEGADKGKGVFELQAPAYTDRFEGGVSGFLRMLDPRLRVLHRLLSPSGSLYLHVDPTVGHVVKLLLDEVFGAQSFQREIVWRIGWVSGFKSKAKNWIRNHDLIFFYVKDPKSFTFNKAYMPYPEGYLRRDGKPPTGRGVPIDDVWNANETEFALRGQDSLDSIQIKSFSTEKSGYATQKNESVLTRIIAASSNPGDLVLDAFCGSGTTGVTARRLGRRFVGVDCSGAAIHIAKKRMLDVASDSALHLERLEQIAPPPAARYRADLAAHRGIVEPPNGDELWPLPRGGCAVLFEPGQIVTVPRIEEAARLAKAAGYARLEVLAPDYDVPLRWSCNDPVDVVLLRVTQDLANAAVAATLNAAVVPLPTIDVELVPAPGGKIQIALHRYDLDLGSCGRNVAGGDAPLGPLDLLDAWTVSWEAGQGNRVDEHYYRTHQCRALTTISTAQRVERTAKVVLRFVDVLYQRTEVELSLRIEGAGPVIAAARRR